MCRLGICFTGAVLLGTFLFSQEKPTPDKSVAPRVLTIQGATTLGKAIEAIQQQCDISIDFAQADSSRDLKLDFDKMPFWPALEQIAKASDHRIRITESGRKISLISRNDLGYRAAPMSFDGKFRVTARRVVSTLDLEQERTTTEVQLELFWEPGFYTFLVEIPSKDVTAKDNTGKELSLVEPGKGRLSVAGGMTTLNVRIDGVPRSARTLKELAGSFSIVGASKMLRFEFSNPSSAGEEKSQDDVKVRLRTDFKENGSLWTARVSLEYPADGPQLESFESAAWIAENDCWLQSTDGKIKLDVNGGLEVVDQTDRRAVINYRWVPTGNASGLGKPNDWKVVVRTPAKLVEVPVKFRLEDIPLP